MIAVSSISLIWFDVLHLGYHLKKLFNYPVHEFIKPFDCLFCTTFWIGVVASLIYIGVNGITEVDLYVLALSIYLNAKIIDKLWS